MKRLALSSCLVVSMFIGSIAHADVASDPGVTLTQPRLLVPNRPLRRRVGIGLAASSALTLILGLTFVGLAKNANDNVLADMAYHPHQETLRDHYEIVHATFFTATVGLFAAGMVLIWDH